MSEATVFNELFKILKRNKLTIESYSAIILCSVNDSFINLFKNLEREKQKLDQSLMTELLSLEEYYREHLNFENGCFQAYINLHSLELGNQDEILEKILEGEENMIMHFKNLLANDLSLFGEVRDILHNHIFRTQLIISELKEIS